MGIAHSRPTFWRRLFFHTVKAVIHTRHSSDQQHKNLLKTGLHIGKLFKASPYNYKTELPILQNSVKWGSSDKHILVTQERFELPTPWFVVKCSIQLSYWAVYGRGRGTQTPNLRFWRPLLYQLRYAPVFLHRYHLCDCNIITNIFGKSKQFSKMIPLLPFFNRLFSL